MLLRMSKMFFEVSSSSLFIGLSFIAIFFAVAGCVDLKATLTSITFLLCLVFFVISTTVQDYYVVGGVDSLSYE